MDVNYRETTGHFLAKVKVMGDWWALRSIRKLTDQHRSTICHLYAGGGCSDQELADYYGVSKTAILHIVKMGA